MTNGAAQAFAVARERPLRSVAGGGGDVIDGATLSPYPQHSWLRFTVVGPQAPQPLVVNTHGACHTLSLTARGHHDVRWITRGRERRWSEHAGTVHFVPADNEHHVFITAMSADFASNVLLLPRHHLEACLAEEGVKPGDEGRRILAPDDPVLRSCISRLMSGDRQHGGTIDAGEDEAARRIVLRLAELAGGGRPDWHDDVSIFDRRTLADLADHIDGHLRDAPALHVMALRVGLSPSHFAKKFRQSTGLSLHRFVNRRRVRAALALLQDRSQSLAAVALDLGFSSQSHFTRLFSDLTGMTPAKYRKHFNR